MQRENGVSGTNSGSLKVKTVVALVPNDVAHPLLTTIPPGNVPGLERGSL